LSPPLHYLPVAAKTTILDRVKKVIAGVQAKKEWLDIKII
jgi:hypothetical protein